MTEPESLFDEMAPVAPRASRTPAAPVGSAPPPEPGSSAPSFQRDASRQGRQFAEQCQGLLEHAGYTLHGPRVLTDVGIEIDCEAVSPSGATVWFEYKGSVQGPRPGLRRTDTLKKAIANGALLAALGDVHPPFVVLTSHLPEAGSGLAMLTAALRLGHLADVVCIYDPKQVRRLATL